MNICVFASSSDAIPATYTQASIQLAEAIGRGGHTLINGAGNIGLMGIMLDAAQKCGARTVGVIPEKLHEFGLSWDGLDELHVTVDMASRKAMMRQLADAFIVAPGGFGTLEEALEVVTLKQLDYHRKPIVFLNTCGFFDDLFRQFERSFEEHFAKPVYATLYHIAPDSPDAMRYLENYRSFEAISKFD
ncbi:MAG: TIGR00730 family Rossman fold protein [Bacteroidales bacterium]|jgi:uncharacterized protein (TIGR00730 family)|nr:TIGR00730 family Rossman fold protein [Bacteroidales bacterium]